MVQVIIECCYLSEIEAVLTGIKPQGTDNSYRMPGVARSGKDYLMWRVMILTGARIGEALALDRPDLVSQGLRIDESALNGQAS